MSLGLAILPDLDERITGMRLALNEIYLGYLYYCAVQNSGYFSSKLDQTIFLRKDASETALSHRGPRLLRHPLLLRCLLVQHAKTFD